MDSKPIIAIALIISAVLLSIRVSPGFSPDQFREGKYIHVDNMVIEFNKANATVNLKYHLTPFAQVYTFLFGSKNLKPKIMEIFVNFKEVKIQKIGFNSATLQITNISRKSGQDYLHESKKLGVSPDVLTIVYPYNQGSRKLQNPDSTLNTFYPVYPPTQNSTSS